MATVSTDSRGHVELVHGPEIDALPLSELASGWPEGARVKTLSRDHVSGAFSGILQLPQGYERPAGHLEADTEYLVLSGWIRVGEALRGYGYFDWAPSGTTTDAWHVLADTEILFLPRTGRPDFEPGAAPAGDEGRICLDSQAMPWESTPVPHGPKRIGFKLLRSVPETGEMSALITGPPDSEHPVIEFHDCVEEMFKIVGDTWLRNSGTMEAGSYFWRPPYITHGPFRSRNGGISYLYVDRKLINFFVDDPESPVEANMEQAARERAEGRTA